MWVFFFHFAYLLLVTNLHFPHFPVFQWLWIVTCVELGKRIHQSRTLPRFTYFEKKKKISAPDHTWVLFSWDQNDGFGKESEVIILARPPSVNFNCVDMGKRIHQKRTFPRITYFANKKISSPDHSEVLFSSDQNYGFGSIIWLFWSGLGVYRRVIKRLLQ